VLEGGAIYFALDSKHQSDTLNLYKGEWGQPQKDIQARGERDAHLAWGLGAAGVVAVGVGVALVVIGGHADERAIAIAPTRGGAFAAWSTRF